jgi:kumamolisin
VDPESPPTHSVDDSAVKAEELRVRKLEAAKALADLSSPWWRRADPLVLAILAGALSLLGNMVVSFYNNRANVEQEQIKAKDDLNLELARAKYNLVLQAMTTNDAAAAKRNIHFFIDAGLLPDADCKIRDAIDKDQPVLPSLSGVAPATPPGLHSAPEIAALYNFPSGYDGRGVKIGILEFGGAILRDDLEKYFKALELPVPEITSVSVEGAAPKPDSIEDGIVMMDLEIIGALAPAAQIRVYFGDFQHGGYARAIERATADRVAVLSTNWGQAETLMSPDDIMQINAALENAARQGITVVAAAGDNGVTAGVDMHRHVFFPASSPWVLSVGGTTLKSEAGKITSETVWNGHDFGTGGGFSEKLARPDWQPASLIPKDVDASSGRGVPDVVASANPELGTPILVHGAQNVFGGTSESTDVWAGLIVRLDQALGYNVGHLNPRLYRDIGPAGLLHAITSGNNGVGSVPGYSAGDGWTPVAGWGSPDGVKLLAWLREHPDPQIANRAVAPPPCQLTSK